MTSILPCLEDGVGLEVSMLPLSCFINGPLIFLRTCNCSPSRLIGITLSCFEEMGVAFESSLVPLFRTCDGDPEDNWIGITLSFLAVSLVVVVAITVGGLDELENIRKLDELDNYCIMYNYHIIFRRILYYCIHFLCSTYQKKQSLIALLTGVVTCDQNIFNIL